MSCSEDETYQFFCHEFEGPEGTGPCAFFPYAAEQCADASKEGLNEIHNLVVHEGPKTLAVNEKLFHVPRDTPVDLEVILEGNMKLRFLEDEGLHVHSKPEVLRKMNYKMSNRLIIQDKGKRWFGEDGCIIALPDPLQQYQGFRIALPSQTPSCLANVFQKCVMVGEAKDSEKLWEMDLNLTALAFTHHPLFSQEHVLAQRLLELYEHYHTRKTHEKTAFLQDKLMALRSLESRFKRDKVVDDSKLRTLHHKILETQKLIEAEMETEYRLIKKIVAVWNEIKALRAKNGYISTTIKLQLQRKKIPVSLSPSVSANDKDDVKEPKSSMESVITQHYICMELKELEKEEESYFNNTPVTVSHTRTEYAQFTPILYMNEIVTPDCNCPIEEQLRRHAVLQHRLSLKVFYNGKPVSYSEKRAFSSDFRVNIQQIFTMQVVTSPESITLEVYEYVRNKCSFLARVHVPVPDRNMLSSNTPTEWSDFSSEQVVRAHYTGLGSSSQEDRKVNLLTSGRLFYTMSWAVDESGLPLAPPVLPSKPRRFFTPMTSWPLLRDRDIRSIKGLEFDPNHPANIILNELLKESEQRLRGGGHFCLTGMEEEYQFATDEQLGASKRFSVIRLRSAQELEITPSGPIPLHDQQISDDMLNEYSTRPTPLFLEDNCISAQRARSMYYIQKMLNLRRKRFLIIQKRYHLSDIVHEHQEADTALTFNCDMFRPVRRLKPRRVQKRSVPCSTLSDGELKIRVAINSAKNLPVREHACLLHTLGSYCGLSSSRNACRYFSESGRLENKVHPFAEVTFQGVTYETRTEQGCNPNWREEFIFDFKSTDCDYSLSGLTKIEDVLIINIFDEVSFHLIESSPLNGCAVRAYCGKQWLGSVALPFTALLRQSKVNCIFRVESPPTFLGYSWSEGCGFGDEDSLNKGKDTTIYLSVFITLEPPVHLKEITSVNDNEKPLCIFSTQEHNSRLDYANEFKRYCRKTCQGKRVVTTVMSIVGEIVLVNSFFRPVPPPQELLNSDMSHVSALERVARFVSLIPTMPGPSDVGDGVEILLTSEQCLELVMGNSVSLAVLLCNFFLYLDTKAWVALGMSVTEGETAYVLTEHSNGYKLWSPRDGRHYQISDIFCPLKTVDCLINGQNVWLHKVQTTCLPKTFDLRNDEIWTRMFSGGGLFSPSSSVPSKIRYRPPQVELIKQLQRSLELRLKNSLMDWRSPHPTRWNSRWCAQLAAILPRLEHNPTAFAIEPEIYTMLDSVKEYQVTGMPIHMAFVDVNQVIRVVRNTRIHCTEIPGTQFALAIHIEAYPNDILSVWVFLATLVRRQEETHLSRPLNEVTLSHSHCAFAT